MRVISQKREIDIDYNNSIFFVEKVGVNEDRGYKITCQRGSVVYEMGRYTTHDRAIEILGELSKTNAQRLLIKESINSNQMILSDGITANIDKPFNSIEVTVLPDTMIYYFPEQ